MKQEEKQNDNSNGNENGDDENDDLYGDLKDEMTTPTASTVTTTMTQQHPPPKQRLIPLKPPSVSLPIDVQKEQEEKITMKFKQEIESLKNENEVLKRNIGTLYRTAKLELERKDARISELELELSSLSR